MWGRMNITKNHKKGPRRSWVRNHMGNPSLILDESEIEWPPLTDGNFRWLWSKRERVRLRMTSYLPG